jgi:hypothetical protein
MLVALCALRPVLTAAAAATCSWEAVLLVLDSRPFEDLHHIVEDFQDDRIWVFAEWVRAGMCLLPAQELLIRHRCATLAVRQSGTQFCCCGCGCGCGCYSISPACPDLPAD